MIKGEDTIIKAVIFDFDGTLANTLPICFYAFQSVFKQFDNRGLSADEIVKMFGPSEIGIIQENLQNSNKNAAIEYFYEKYSESHADFVKQNTEIQELLYHLKGLGIQIGIFTGKAQRSLDISLKKLSMDGLFDVMITGDDVVEPKPAPEGLLKVLDLLEVDNT
nr:HAD hydrolase-like protein [Bacillus ndiopicus]